MDDSRLCRAVVIMSRPNGLAPQQDPAPPRVSPNLLARIPLRARMGVYATSFLCLLLVVLPRLAHGLDAHLPQWHFELGGPLRYLGLAVFLASMAVYMWSSRLLSSRGHGAYVEFDPPRDLVVTGIYRWVRNPVAGSAVLMLLGEAMFFSSTGILLLSAAAAVVAHFQVVYLEEPVLRKRFGKSYSDYLARVPRWIPRPPEGDRP
jgi:protein-S-isoprenylcysteine O-methyltransferase Ste14